MDDVNQRRKTGVLGAELRPLVRLIAARRWIVALEGHSRDFTRSEDRRGNGAPDERDVKQRREQISQRGQIRPVEGGCLLSSVQPVCP